MHAVPDGLTPTPSLREEFVQVLSAVEDTNDLRRVVLHAIENDMRIGEQRTQPRPKSVSRPAAEGMPLKHCGRADDVVDDFVGCILTSRVAVIASNVQ